MIPRNDLVDIIVPVYNVEPELPRCVASLTSQTYENIRIWLVDDGSTDSCGGMSERYAQQDARIRVIHKINGGLSSARNAALDAIFNLAPDERGGFIACVDSDDWVEPDYIEFLYRLAADTGADIAQCGHWISFSEKREVCKSSELAVHLYSGADAMESLLRNGEYDVTAWNKLYRIELFHSLRYPEGKSYEDTATADLLCAKANLVAVCMQPKYHYVQRYTSIANGRAWSESKLDLLWAGDGMAERVVSRYPELSAAALEKQVYVRLSTLSQMVNTGYRNRKLAKELRGFIVCRAWKVLRDPRASTRVKLGVASISLGCPFYRLVWGAAYKIRRRLAR